MRKSYIQPSVETIEFDGEALMQVLGKHSGETTGEPIGASEGLSNHKEFEQSSIWDGMNDE